MPDARLDDVAIDDLVSDFLAQRRRGDRTSIADFARRHPRWETEIRRLLPAALALERFKDGRQASSAEQAAARPHPSLAETRLGDYMLLEEVGHGGMGVVYRARQTSLGRIVAVKVLRAGSVAGSKQERRFARESQAAAALHHTNIVPVFGVGHQDGIHYYVMQLIEGEGLDNVISELARLEAKQAEANRAEANTDARNATLAGGRRRPSASEVARVLLGVRGQRSASSGHLNETEKLLGASTHRSGRLSDLERAESDAPSSGSPYIGSPSSASESRSSRRNRELLNVREEAEASLGTSLSARRDSAATRHYWRSVARIGQEVAEALQYAHSQGTLHRDIKPGNLIVDQRGCVWVTDFGLAKVMHNDSLTETGDVVGTLRYMAPEQFSGRADERSDIYGLGMTLYELATLHPAFDATGRAGLIDQIMRQEPIRPRKVRPAIPRDLETILLKAISRDPNHRYRSAAEMAEDLERFLDDRPVRARRVGPVERFWRWCRRNPAIAVPTAAAAALLVLACTVATGAYVNESTLRERAELASAQAEVNLTKAREEQSRADENTRKALAEQQAAQQERRRAQKNLALALQAIEEVFERTAPSGLQQVADEQSVDSPLDEYQVVVTPEDAALLESMLSFYDRFAEENATNLKLQFEAARAHRRVGDIHQRLGQFEEAESAYGRSLDLYDRLQKENPRAQSVNLAIASLLNELGVVEKMMGRREEAQFSHREALAILQQEYRGDPESTDLSLEMVRTYNLLNYAIWRRHTRALSDDDVQLVTQAQDNHRMALELLEQLMDSDPLNPEYRLTLARSYRDLAPVLWNCDLEGTAEVTRSAINILESLVAEYPSVPLYRYELVLALSTRFHGLGRGKDFDEVRRRFERAIELSAELSEEFATVPEYASRYAYTCRKFSDVLDDAKLHDEAECMLLQAMDLRRNQVRRFPDVPQFQTYLVFALKRMADMVQTHGDLPEAALLLEEAVEVRREQVLHSTDDAPRYQEGLAKSLSDLAGVVQHQDDLERARRLLEEAIKLRRIQVYQFPEESRNQESLANSLGELAAVAKRSGDLQESQLLLEESIALLTQLVESNDGGRFRSPLSDKYGALYGVLAEQGLEAEARAAWSKAHKFNPSHRPAPWRGRSMFSRRPESSRTDSNRDELNRKESTARPGDRNRLAPADADE